MSSNEYRILEFHLESELSPCENRLLEAIRQEWKAKDFSVDRQEDRLSAHLKLLDIEKFRSMIIQHNVESKSVFYHMLESIDSIGSYGIKGGKRLYTGYNDERKVLKRKDKEQKRNKHYYANGHGFAKHINVVPQEYIDRIICADSETFLKLLPDNSVDLVLTSPPYNFGLDYGDHNDANHWEKYFDKLFRIFAQCIRVVKYGGRIVINVQPLFSDYIPSHHLISNFFVQNHMLWKGEILWEKNNYNCKYTAWGSWKSPSSPYLKYTWEFIEVFCKGDLTKKGEASKIDITADEFKQWVLAKWSISPERKMKEYDHPAMFPEQLAERVLKLFSYQEDIILDPFNGAGTTTAVAQRLNRRFIGIDNSEDYCATAMKRLKGAM